MSISIRPRAGRHLHGKLQRLGVSASFVMRVELAQRLLAPAGSHEGACPRATETRSLNCLESSNRPTGRARTVRRTRHECIHACALGTHYRHAVPMQIASHVWKPSWFEM
eukprot:3013932-Pleurochrysis_carterae.AAC.4